MKLKLLNTFWLNDLVMPVQQGKLLEVYVGIYLGNCIRHLVSSKNDKRRSGNELLVVLSMTGNTEI